MLKKTALASLMLALSFPLSVQAGRHGRRGPYRHAPPASAETQTLHGEARLDPSLGDRDIDVCLADAVRSVQDGYAAFADGCREAGGAPASDPAEIGTNLVTFNEVTLLCTLDVTATCTPPTPPAGCAGVRRR